MSIGWKIVLAIGMIVIVAFLIDAVTTPLQSGIPLYLTDAHWGELSKYGDTVRRFSNGMTRAECRAILTDRVYSHTNGSDIVLTWISQQKMGYSELRICHVLQFDERGSLTNVAERRVGTYCVILR